MNKLKTFAEERAYRRIQTDKWNIKKQKKLHENKCFFVTGKDGIEYWNSNTNLNFVTGYLATTKVTAENKKCDIQILKYPKR